MSTKVGNLFVAIGNTELSDKMASCMTDLNVSVVRYLYSYGASCSAG